MLLSNQLRYLSSTILLAACFCAGSPQQQDVTRPEVTTSQGTLRGTTRTTRRNRTVSAFLGIPYGQPPVGNLRFANPVAADGWNGTRDAILDGNTCPQASGGAEDCLHINVYTPQLPENSSSTLLPVMVWIYGGSFVSGSPSSAEFGPEYILDSDVVLVAPNFRVGPFGFLSTGDEVASGNWGLKDQVLALRWIQDNIKYFGGDPDRVTIAGYSSGAVSIQLLAMSDATKGLFHKYITESGSAFAPSSYQSRATYASRAYELGGYVGCSNDTSASLITCLRGIDASDIVASYPQFSVWEGLPMILWVPTDEPDIEGAVLTDSPANILAAGGIRDLPWMTGVVRDEGGIFTIMFDGSEDILSEFLADFDTLLPEFLMWKEQSDTRATWIEAIKSYYFNNDLTTNNSQLLTNLALLAGDCVFLYPTYNVLQHRLGTAVNPQYFYSFDYHGSLSYSMALSGSLTNYGIVHTDELIYLFEERSSFSSVNASRCEADFRMVDTMVELWTSFAINGTPTTTANNNTVTWGPYSAEETYLQIGNNADLSLKVKHSLPKERMEFWASLNAALSTSDAVTSSDAIGTRNFSTLRDKTNHF